MKARSRSSRHMRQKNSTKSDIELPEIKVYKPTFSQQPRNIPYINGKNSYNHKRYQSPSVAVHK